MTYIAPEISNFDRVVLGLNPIQVVFSQAIAVNLSCYINFLLLSMKQGGAEVQISVVRNPFMGFDMFEEMPTRTAYLLPSVQTNTVTYASGGQSDRVSGLYQ